MTEAVANTKSSEATDTERYRALSKIWITLTLVFTVAGLLLAVHQIFHLSIFTGIMVEGRRYLYIFLAFFLPMVFLLFPATKRASKNILPWYDTVLFVITLVVLSYFAWFAPDIGSHGWEFTGPLSQTVASFMLWLLVLEAIRRVGGRALFIIIFIISLYPLFAGYTPGIIKGFSLSLVETSRYYSMSMEGIVGTPTLVVATIFIGFLAMGAALISTGGGDFFINAASAILGGFRGGVAKVSVVASSLFGTMSGSVVSNVIATGSITIPTMKKAGFSPENAGAIEACASTGSVLMPPIMGAAAFIMATILGIPYLQVAIGAAIPSILYYFSLFLQIDFHAASHGMKGQPREKLPSMIQTIKEGWFFVFVFAVLIWLLVYLAREAQAPFYATALLLLLANIRKKTRLYPHKIFELLVMLRQLMVEVVGMLAGLGLILASLSVTGMAVTFSSDLVQIAGGNIYLLLLMGAITAFILGTGMTVTSVYIILAVVLAPALTSVGLNPLAVHLFILYWSMISYITPPVSVGAFVASSIAHSHPMRTGFQAMRLGAIIYFVPILFVLSPVLIFQEATLASFALAFAKALVGIFLICGGIQGYILGIGKLHGNRWVILLIRLILIAGGVMIGIPWNGV